MKSLVTLALVLLSFCCLGQESKVLLSQLMEEILLSDKENYSISVGKVSTENLPVLENQWGEKEKQSIGKFLSYQYPKMPLDSTGYLIIDKTISIKIAEVDNLEISNLNINTLKLTIDYAQNLILKNCRIDNLILTINQLENHAWLLDNHLVSSSIKTSSNDYNSMFWLHSNILDNVTVSIDGLSSLELINNSFALHKKEIDASDSAYFKINQQLLDYNDTPNSLWLNCQNVKNVIIWKNYNIKNVEEYEFDALSLTGEVENLKILENSIYLPLQFIDLTITKRLEIIKNEFMGFKALGLYRALFPELLINIDWKQFQHKVYILTDASQNETHDGFARFGTVPYFGEALEEMQFHDRCRALFDAYSKFYNHYRNSGDIEAANAVYRELQDLHTLRYKYLASNNPDVKSIFRWRLNQLISYYTGYGTDPVKAIIISIYIIMGFAIFYFFFPSEWDKESKLKTLSNLKTALARDKKSFFKPLIRSFYFMTISLINAITLSLNSFVTLGFGSIPTKGIARYVCIIQGFIGWFLLSLFLVSLFNQVDF